MIFSVCGGGDQLPFSNLSYYATDERGGTSLANLWRISSDVTGSWTLRFSYEVDAGLGQFAGPGGFNDPDMLLGSSLGAARRLEPHQSRTQFSLWAMLMAPMLLGADVRRLTAFDLETYTNEKVLQVSQDPLATQGSLLSSEGATSVWGRELLNGAWAVLFLNQGWLWTRKVMCSQSCWSKMSFRRNSTLHVEDLWSLTIPDEILAGEELSLEVEAGRSRHLAADPSQWLVHTCHPSKNMCTSRAAECNQFCAFVIRLVLQSPDFVVFLCRVLTSIARSIVEKTRKESSVDLIA